MNSSDPATALDDVRPRFSPAHRGAVGWWLAAARRYRLALLAPLAVCFALSVGYALFGPKQWRASQVFHLRDEMIGRTYRPGVFASLDEMKVAQETVLEIARNPEVVGRTLERLGPPSKWSIGAWPSPTAIEQAQDAIQVSATNGAELGKTDLIRMTVRASSPGRAKQFAEILCEETEVEMRKVRYDRARGMQDELGRAVESAQASLDMATKEIERFELDVGPDLAELRNMIEPKTGDILLFRNLGQIQTELRALQSQLDVAQTQRSLLGEALAAENPDVLSTPNEMLNLLPAIKRLKDGWVDAQLKLATVLGDYAHPHPKVIAAEHAVDEIEAAVRLELRAAVSSLDDQVTILQSNVARLNKLADETTARLQRLTEQRVIYDQLNEEYKRRDQVLRELQAELVRTTSMTSAAQSVSLLTRVAAVQVGNQPEGLSKRSLVGGSTLLGLLVGIGLVMFLAGPTPRVGTPPASASHDSRRVYTIPAAGGSQAPTPSAAVAAKVSTPPTNAPSQPALHSGAFLADLLPATTGFSKTSAD